MANPHEHPTALQDLQDSIYREKVLRARAMTPEEKLASVFELAEFQMGMMHAGALSRIGSADEGAGWQEVARWLERLEAARDFRFYSPQNHSAA